MRFRATPATLREGIRQLLVLRTIAVAGQTAAIALASILDVALPLVPMLGIVGGLIGLNVVVWLRLRSPREASRVELLANLGIDLTAFTALLYLSGGASNPFSLIFVLHAVITALLLPTSIAWIGIALVVVLYLALGDFRLPLVMATGDALPGGLLKFGQGLSFTLTTAITAWFVLRMVAALRALDRMLDESSQRALRDDAVLRVGALAAGAAHELATPLTTMAVVAKEIEADAESAALRDEARILGAQIEICRGTLGSLMAAAGHAGAVGGGRERIDRFLQSVADRSRAIHPEASIVCAWNALPLVEIFAEEGFRQALVSLLNNAVEASAQDVRFTAHLHGATLSVTLADHGPGAAPDDLPKLGQAFFTTKPRGKGVGLGLVLASRAIERLGGTLTWENLPGGGLCARVEVPMASLQIDRTI
jgi:two-component system sensor histidine kinase RegB